MTDTDLERLLHELDGHLGLAVYRNEHDDRWKNEAKELISRIREYLKDQQIKRETIQREAELESARGHVLETLAEYATQIRGIR